MTGAIVILALLGGAAVGITHAAAILRHGVTLRPVLVIVLGLAATGVLWTFSSRLSPDEERAWWAFLTGFALGNGILSLSPQARRRPAHR